MARKDIYSDKTLLEFLELDKKEPDLQVKQFLMVGQHTETRAIMDFAYWDKLKMMFLAVGDFSGMFEKGGFFGFGKKKEQGETAGTFAGYVQGKGDSKEIGDFHFQRQWWNNFANTCTACDWNEKLELLVCGESTGNLHFIKPNAEDTSKCDSIAVIKVHSDRIVKIIINESKKVVYSISEDRKFKVTNWEKKEITSEFEISSSRPNCMTLDQTSNLIFVGDNDGNAKVIDVAKHPPSCINSVKVKAKDPVVDIDRIGSLMLAASSESGKVSVYQFADPRDQVV